MPEAGNSVWLTIDDGPGPETRAVLDLLDRHQARATFFLVGERALAQPELVQEILRRGHDLGNHSHSHPQARFWRLGPAAMRAEIEGCQHALQAERPAGALVPLGGGHDQSVRGAGAEGAGPGARGLECPRLRRRRLHAGGRAVAAAAGPAPGAIVLLHEGAAHGTIW
jgi:peptidoglycan/xylan/chitin deacetylase (PgdA/CDA1 family)